MAAVEEDKKLWGDLDLSSAKPGHLIVTTVPDKIERTVKMFESLLLSIASIGERSGGRPGDSAPTR
eukprot:175778-Alexandrium_andersonii.AAC.1